MTIKIILVIVFAQFLQCSATTPSFVAYGHGVASCPNTALSDLNPKPQTLKL